MEISRPEPYIDFNQSVILYTYPDAEPSFIMFLPSYRAAVTYAMCAALALCASPSCQELPQEDTWPSPGQCNILNKTVNGKLVSTVPLVAHCHDPHYDEAACNSLRASWAFSPVQ